MDKNLINDLINLRTIACSHGNWNYDPYMLGFANGIICAIAIISDIEPEYLDPPEFYLKDLEPDSNPILDGKYHYDA